MKTPSFETALEFRTTVRGISPLIWRKVRVSGSLSLHALHQVLCVICEWTGSQPYQFSAHGREFSTNESDLDAKAVTLTDLKLRVGETFAYAHRSHNPWQLDLRLLARRPATKTEILPALLGGKRGAPDEHLADVEAYLTERRRHEYSPPVASLKLAADAVTFLMRHNTRPGPEFMERLAVAKVEIEAYLRYTSPGLDLERINRKLCEYVSGGAA